MDRFGKNPFGENLYRIVFGPSRLGLVDGMLGQKWVRRYPQAGDRWVMEKWLNAKDYTGVTREQWAMDPLLSEMGPYPSRGEYELCWVFDGLSLDDTNIDLVIRCIEEGKKRRPVENEIAIRDDADREEKQKQETVKTAIKDMLSPFGTGAFIAYGGKRGTKNRAVVKTANELGLPLKSGQIRSRGRKKPRPTFEIPVSA